MGLFVGHEMSHSQPDSNLYLPRVPGFDSLGQKSGSLEAKR
jgi:hypothetical protein